MNRITKGIWISAVVTTLLLSSFSTFAQKKKSSKGSSYNWGIGVKLGDPTGITVKKYNGNKAWEFILGRTYYWGGNSYYDYRFRHDERYKDKGYYGWYYDRGVAPIALQVRHLFFHKDIDGLDGLRWYLGLGGQFRYSSYTYHYYDIYGRLYDDRVADWGIGADGIIGLEYTFEDVPLSIGLDANLYMEVLDRPFLFLGQGGLAIRYNF